MEGPRKFIEETRKTKLGIPIRRQHPLGTVVVDFYCPRAKVAIELDGAHHDARKDAERDRKLAAQGVFVLRFENYLIREDLDRVITAIRELVQSRSAVLRETRTSADEQASDAV